MVHIIDTVWLSLSPGFIFDRKVTPLFTLRVWEIISLLVAFFWSTELVQMLETMCPDSRIPLLIFGRQESSLIFMQASVPEERAILIQLSS